MSRPLKQGLDYFPLDVGIFEEDKLFDIQNDYGCLGEVIYLRLLCLVYRNGFYYKFDSLDKLASRLIKSIGSKWIGNKSTVKQVICALVEVGLFAKAPFSSNVITAESIQRRYLKACERRRSIITNEYWLLTDESGTQLLSDSKNSINADINGNIAYNNEVNVCNKYTKESKVKESKNKRESIERKSCVSDNETGTLTRSICKEEFVVPSLEEVEEYCKAEGLNVNAEKFWANYEANGWMLGNSPMQSWKGACKKWSLTEKEFSGGVSGGSGTVKNTKPPNKAREGLTNEYTKEQLAGVYTSLDDLE